MAIYKPNNFYPYMQEVDLESDEGVIFSCQANTDGNSMIRAARLRILDKDNNVILYEKIQNLDNPVFNGEIVEFKVEPYYFDIKQENTLINFVTLTPNESIENRLNYCPYNMYQKQIYDLNCFNINYIINSEINSIDNYKIIIDENSNYLFSMNYLQNGEIRITLKNNKDYVWDIELFEDFINTIDYDGTYISNGILSGSTENILWIDKNLQNDELLKHIDKINDEKYVECIFNEDNSDIYKEKINEGFTLSGSLFHSINKGDEGVELFTSNQGNFYKVNTSNSQRNIRIGSYLDYSSNIYYYYIPCTQYNGYYNFGECYELNDSKIKIKDNINNYIDEQWKNRIPSWEQHDQKGSMSKDQWANTDRAYYSKALINYKNILKKTVKTISTAIYENGDNRYGYFYDEAKDSFLKKNWRYVYNIDVEKNANNTDFNFIFSNNVFVGETGDDIVFSLSSLGTLENTQVDINMREIFLTKNAETTIIACAEPAVAELDVIGREKIENKVALNNSNVSMTTFPNEYVLCINDIPYRIRVLTPKPYNPKDVKLYYHYMRYSTLQASTTSYTNVAYLSKYDHDWNYTYGDFSEFLTCDNNGSIRTDYDCFSNQYYNCFEDFMGNGIIDYVFYHEDNGITEEQHFDNEIYNIENENNNIYGLILNDDYSIIGGKENLLQYNTFDITVIQNEGKEINENDINITIYDNNSYNYLNVDNNIKKESDGNCIQTGIIIPEYISHPYLKINILNGDAIKEIKITSGASQSLENILIDKNTIPNIKLENLYISILNNGNIIGTYKVKKIINNILYLIDEGKQKEIFELLSAENASSLYYSLFYKQREKISYVANDLGQNYNFFKIELEEPMSYNLNNESEIQIYNHNNKNTYNSFFGPIKLNEIVDNLYVRFPGYEGKDAIRNEIKDIKPYFNEGPDEQQKIKGWFYSGDFVEDIPFQDISIYGTNVRAEAFEENDDFYCKLFKVTRYDEDTGEIVFSGGLEREILDTDRYEIWKSEKIEGSTNEYNITEVITRYTRIYPKNNEIYEEAYAGEELFIDKEYGNYIISTSTSEQLFLQPNTLLYVNEYNVPYLFLNNLNEKVNFKYLYNKQKYSIDNFSINPLDNSQWLILNQNNLIKSNKTRVGEHYDLYFDYIKSTQNYFYARNIEKLELYAIPSTEFSNKTLDEINIDNYLFDNNILDNCNMVSFLDFYIYGNYNHKEPLKKYILKIYNENMNLLYNSKEVYDSKILYHVKGLNNNEIYYMTIECENQLGNITIYEHVLSTQYIENISENIKLKVENDCEKSGLVISLINQDNSYCWLDDLINEGVYEDAIIKIYRKNKYGNIKWIHNIDVQNDKNYYGYSFIDYNVNNNEYYEYYAVLSFTINSEGKSEYLFVCGNGKTQFDSWTIVDIIQNEDDKYSVVGDVWSFRYNLESEDLVQNTSVTTWDTLGKYGQVGKGEKNFISSGMRCLLGDVGYYKTYDNNNQIIKKYGYNEKGNIGEDKLIYNNITKYQKWQQFCNSFSKKLLKDIKGNKWIVQIVENPNVSNDDNSREQLYTISFSWYEVADSNDISICNNLVETDINFPTLESNNAWYKGLTDKSTITKIDIVNSYTPTGNETESWEASIKTIKNNTNDIMCYIEGTTLTIAGNGSGKIFANPDSRYMFQLFSNVVSIDGLDLFDTSNVTDMYHMFEYCRALTNLDLSNFNTSSVTYMGSMFHACMNLTSLDLSNFNTSNVTDMNNMFYECSNLTSLDLSNFNTSNVTYMDDMFGYCSSLISLDLSNFNTSNVTNMFAMFTNCRALTSLDLSNFNTSNVRDTQAMFYRCTNLVTIFASNKFNTDLIQRDKGMFSECSNLVGGSGTVYNINHTDKTYARIDTASTPGYFTAKNS